jgi:hypothetical protein
MATASHRCGYAASPASSYTARHINETNDASGESVHPIHEFNNCISTNQTCS